MSDPFDEPTAVELGTEPVPDDLMEDRGIEWKAVVEDDGPRVISGRTDVERIPPQMRGTPVESVPDPVPTMVSGSQRPDTAGAAKSDPVERERVIDISLIAYAMCAIPFIGFGLFSLIAPWHLAVGAWDTATRVVTVCSDLGLAGLALLWVANGIRKNRSAEHEREA